MLTIGAEEPLAVAVTQESTAATGEYPHRIDEIRAVVKGLTSNRRRKASISWFIRQDR
jgi:hypothetical protein